jgi:hypothetical protein
LSPRCCVYCEQSFEPSKYRPDQKVCSRPECQRRRRSDYHRRKLAADPEYAQVVRDSQKKWRDAHPGYQKAYFATHPEAAQRNRQSQHERDRKRRLTHLEKNNLVSSKLFIFQPAVRPNFTTASS